MTTGFVASSKARVLTDQFNISQFIKRLAPAGSSGVLDCTTLPDESKTYQLGVNEGMLSMDGLYHTNNLAGATLQEIFAPPPSGAFIVSAFPEGFAAGKPAFLMSANRASYTLDVVVSDLVKSSIQCVSANSDIEAGVSLHDLVAETATANGTSVDNLVASTNGGVANLHVTSIAGAAPSVTFKVQHSTNGSTWTDLLTGFAAMTAIGKQRIAVAAGTTVNRFLRAVVTFGGTTTSVVYNLSFARRF